MNCGDFDRPAGLVDDPRERLPDMNQGDPSLVNVEVGLLTLAQKGCSVKATVVEVLSGSLILFDFARHPCSDLLTTCR